MVCKRFLRYLAFALNKPLWTMPNSPRKRPGRPPKPDAEKAANFSVRLPPELRGKLEEAAIAAGRSTNAEIVFRLQGSFEVQEESPKRQVVVDAMQESVAEAVRWWEAFESMPDASEYENQLKDAMDDLEMWLDRLKRFDSPK
ncbi:hypothetical protein VL23_06315 [Stenotrophomonas maltophilia]|uniref:Arc-like DNA binding domain-containing protein n=2 Tax=Stenotrophomonas maltophilia TaxID=40324 RepID=A0AB34TIF8_STEMA|nr:hypothetical protein VL23_06315 [Stenotrophomonas maltophilia]